MAQALTDAARSLAASHRFRARTGAQSRGAMVISDWKPHTNDSRKDLRGFFSVTLFNGLTLRRLTLHERGAKRSVRLPAREWIDVHGRKEFVRVVEFVNRAAARDFADQILAALDEHLKEKSK